MLCSQDYLQTLVDTDETNYSLWNAIRKLKKSYNIVPLTRLIIAAQEVRKRNIFSHLPQSVLQPHVHKTNEMIRIMTR